MAVAAAHEQRRGGVAAGAVELVFERTGGGDLGEQRLLAVGERPHALDTEQLGALGERDQLEAMAAKQPLAALDPRPRRRDLVAVDQAVAVAARVGVVAERAVGPVER